MTNSSNITMFDGPKNNEARDAMTIARLPELIEKLEETAYTLVRHGESETGYALFMAVAAFERAEKFQANRRAS